MGTRARVLIAAFTAVALLGACGDDSSTTTPSTGATTTTGGTTTSAPLTASFRGVTATAIKIGVVLIDYDGCIAQYIDFSRGDQQKVAQAFIDDINSNGGVAGRSLEPVYKTYCPIGNDDALAVCTSLTDDEQVFAVIGVFIDDSGEAQLCLTKEHETIHIGHELKQEWIDQAPPGLLLTPDITAERRINVLMSLIKQENYLEGKKVAILADQNSKVAADNVIVPALDDLGLERGSEAVITIEGEDTSAAQSQLDSFIEKWKGEGVNALFVSGLFASAKQFIEKIRAGLPDVVLLTDSPSGVGSAAQDEVAAGVSPNPYEGITTADGETASEHWKSDAVQQCVATYEAASGETVVGPDDLVPGPDGKRAEVYVTVEDMCGDLTMFKEIAEKVGPNLTNDAWVEAVNSFGPIDLVSTSIASLGEGKYDADNAFRLEVFDSTIPPNGDWKPLTELKDASA